MKRRTFIKGITGFAGMGLGTGVYAWQIEPFWLQFVRKKMPVKNLPTSLEGLSLMQISDLHVGNMFDWHYLINSLKEAQKLNPDFVVYTGDYVTYENRQQFDQLQEVLKYKVRGRKGTVGILGNHDYGRNWAQDKIADTITDLLRDAGIDVLRNEQKEISGLNFIGLDDYWAPNFQPDEVMKHYDRQKINLILCHNPDVCDLDVWYGHQGWILSGHTHGGQCKPPFLDPPILPVRNERYSAGEIDLHDGRTLYVNRALGHLFQVRFNVRPEITIFELQRS